MPVNAFETLTVSSSPVSISSALVGTDAAPKWMTRATLSVENGSIRMTRDKDATPSNASNTGLVFPAGAVFDVTNMKDIINIKMIRATATDAKVFVELDQE